MIMRSAALALAYFLSIQLAAAATDSPLLDYALAQKFEPTDRDLLLQKQLKYARYDLDHNPPPAAGCAQTLGANRFAGMHRSLGEALSQLGDYEASIQAYRDALGCAPRDASTHERLAWDLMRLGRYAEARDAAQRSLGLDESGETRQVLAQLDYIEERWPDAIAHLREVAAATADDERATYWQCFLWLAQRRSGIEHPALVARDRAESWPQPILAVLAGSMTEAELVETIEAEDDPGRRREILVEALYYVGQLHLTAGRPEQARRYMAAAVSLKVPYFIEHDMSRAELAKFRSAAR